MSVYLRNDMYHYRFMHRGRVIRRSTKQRNYKVACQMEAAHVTALSQGDAGLGEKAKLPTLAHFLEHRVKPWSAKRKASTATWYASAFAPLESFKPLGNLTLDAITSEHVDAYTAERQSKGKAVGTINRELRVLRRCLRLAVAWRLLDKAPEVSMAGAEKRRERVVLNEEFKTYLGFASPLLTDVAILLNETGLRPDEAHRLEWLDINFSAGRILVRHGKTPAARRQLPMTATVRQVLTDRWLSAGKPDTGFVFPAPTKSHHVEHFTLKKQHRAALKGSKVRPFVLYSLRHTFATRIAPHVDAFTLCKVMGWASLSIAMTYVHAQDDRVLAAFSQSSEIGGHEIGHTPETLAQKDCTGKLQTIQEPEGYVMSAAGFEPATHALKGHCSTN
jgi:integrase